MVNQLKMADTQTLLALYAKGWSARRIARELGMNRETVGRYIRLQRQADSKPAIAPTGSAGPDSGLASAAAVAVSTSAELPAGGSKAPGQGDIPATQPRAAGIPVLNTSSPGRPSVAAPWRNVIVEKLKAGLDAQRIYQDLTAPEYGYQGTYYSVRRLVAKLSAYTELPMRRMECAAGMEAQVDFGRGAALVDAQGHRRGTWVFRIVLSHSRKGYSEAVLRQSTDDFLRALENAFSEFGGVPQTLVIDNLKAAVTRADWFDPELCPKMRSFAAHYQVAILPTKPYTPRHKGKIENGIQYVKNNALKARTFATLADQNQHLWHWEHTVADTRIHGTTRQQVFKVFIEHEKPALQALPAGRFDLFEEALRQVHRDGHVQVKDAYYSVGPEYMGQRVWVRWDGRMVRIFNQQMSPIAVHAQVSPGKFSTQSRHIAPEKIGGIERGASWMLGQVDRIGPEAKLWAEKMLQDRGIEGMRVLMGLLSLSHQWSPGAIDQACRTAREHGAYHLRTVRNLIRHQKAGQEIPRQKSFGFIQEHPIIRPMAEYQQFIHDALIGRSTVLETNDNKETL